MIEAARIFMAGNLELTKSYVDNTIAQAYLADAQFQTQISCVTAADDIANAQKSIALLGTGGPNLTIQVLQESASASYQKKCG